MMPPPVDSTTIHILPSPAHRNTKPQLMCQVHKGREESKPGHPCGPRPQLYWPHQSQSQERRTCAKIKTRQLCIKDLTESCGLKRDFQSSIYSDELGPSSKLVVTEESFLLRGRGRFTREFLTTYHHSTDFKIC